MNKYQVRIYNSTISYRSEIISNFIIQNIIEPLYYINLCKKKSIISHKPWIGIINSLNCSTNFLNHYLAMNMNLLFTTSYIKIENIPTCIIKNDDFLELHTDIVYTASINNTGSYFKNVTLYLVYAFVFLVAINIIKNVYKWIKKSIYKTFKNKKIKTIKFTEQHNDKKCTICIEDFELNSNVSILQCEHIYHKKCIYEWIHSKNDDMIVKCPNCNTLIYTNDEELSESLI